VQREKIANTCTCMVGIAIFFLTTFHIRNLVLEPQGAAAEDIELDGRLNIQ